MFKKLLVTLVAFLLAGACVLAAGAAAEPATGVRPIEADSPCPASVMRGTRWPRAITRRPTRA